MLALSRLGQILKSGLAQHHTPAGARMSPWPIPLSSFTSIGIHAFSMTTRWCSEQKFIDQTLTLLALRFRTHLSINLPSWVDAAGSLSYLDAHSKHQFEFRIVSTLHCLYLLLLVCAHIWGQRKILLLLATSIYCEYLETTVQNLLLSLWFLYSSLHKPFLLVACRLVDIWLTLV